MGMEASGQALSVDVVKSKILQDVRLKQGPKSSSKEAFYSDKEHQKRRKSADFNMGKGDCCFNCRKPGH